MSNITSLRPLAAVVAAALAATLLIALPSRSDGATTIDYPNTERIPGDDPVEIGVNISQRLFGDDGAQAVVLARKDKFPDALGGSSVAAEFGGPILYTTSTDLDTATRNEIDRVLTPGDNVYIMGEVAAISIEVEQELQARGYRTPRLGGPTRVETAAEAAFAVGAGPGRTAIIARAFDDPGRIESTQGWVDSVSCGGYAAFREMPVLLTDKNRDPQRIPDATRSMLQRLGISEVFICGGPAAVPQAHADDIAAMGIKVNRFDGVTRIETAVDVASNLWGYRTTDGKAFIIVNGWGANFAYGLAASQLSRREAAPILLVNSTEPTSCSGDQQSRATLCYLAQHNPSISGLIAVGDVSLVNDAVFRAAAEAGGLEEDNTAPSRPSNVTATDKPEDNGTNVNVKWAASTDDNGGPITYNVYFRNSADDEALTRSNSTRRTTRDTGLTITGLTEGQSYDVAVDAVDRFGNRSGLSAVANAGPLEDEVPAAPGEAPTASNSTTGVRLSWKAAPEADAAGYRIERAAPRGGGPIQEPCDSPFLSWAKVGKDISGRSTTSTTDTTAEDDTRYCYRYRVFDTSSPANESGPSPVLEWTFDRAAPDTTPPAGSPSFYAVNIDQQRGLLPTNSSPSRAQSPQSVRTDVVVPAGAFKASETSAFVNVFDGETRVGRREFDPTGAGQVITLTANLGGPGTRALSASLEDASTNQSSRSTVWNLNVNGQHLPTPVIEEVAFEDVAPANHQDKRIPGVGSNADPRGDATPRIVVGNISPSRGDVQLLVFQNGTLLETICVPQSQIFDQRYIINSDDAPTEVTIPSSGVHALVVAVQPFVPSCASPVGQADASSRSGDSNTVSYVFQSGVFDVLTVTPKGRDPFGFRQGDGPVEVEVTFTAPATTGASTAVAITEADGSVVHPSVANDSGEDAATPDAETVRFEVPSASLPAGDYVVVISATEAGPAPQDTISLNVPFHVGFVDQVFVTRASNAGNTQPAGSGQATYVVAAAAPAGTYTAYDESGPPIATVNHSPDADGEPTRMTGADPGTETISWEYSITGPPPRTSFRQADGTIPAAFVAGDLDDIAIRQQAGSTKFQVDIVNANAAPFTGWHTYYRPATGSSNDFQSAPFLVAKGAAEVAGAIDNTAVSGGGDGSGYKVFFYRKDPSSGNEGPVAQDHVIRKLSSITPTDGLPPNPSPAQPQLQANDSLRLSFNNTSLAAGPGAIGETGGFAVFANDQRVNPKFTAPSSGRSTTSISGGNVTITFGSATTVGGQPVPQAVSPPTKAHSGSANWIGLNWLIDTANGSGHVVLMPPNSCTTTCTNVNTF